MEPLELGEFNLETTEKEVYSSVTSEYFGNQSLKSMNKSS